MKGLMGIDVGSTTVKIAVLDSNKNLIYSSYVRHLSRVKETVLSELKKVAEKLDGSYSVSISLSESSIPTRTRRLNWAGKTRK